VAPRDLSTLRVVYLFLDGQYHAAPGAAPPRYRSARIVRRFPAAHHQRIRTTNRLERLNGETRRRTKVIPRFPTARSCLSLLCATLITASKRWRGIPMTVADVKQLQQLRAAIAVPTKEDAAA
jgi:hypothetical protein